MLSIFRGSDSCSGPDNANSAGITIQTEETGGQAVGTHAKDLERDYGLPRD